jgi:HAMP domain-containing protein
VKLDPRRRFRDRLLVGMVAVALLPLAAFAVLSVVDLDAISRSTANEAQGAILQAEQGRQQSAQAGNAGLLDARLDAIDSELLQLSGQMSRQLATVTAGQVPADLAPHQFGSGVVHTEGAPADPSVVILSSTASADDARVINASAGPALLSVMQGIRHRYPEVTSVWAADRSGQAIRVSPGFDVDDALSSLRLDPAHTEWRAGSDVFTASQQRLAAGGSSVWRDPTDAQHGGAIWTDPFKLLATGTDGVSGWILLHDGRSMVGVDVSISTLVSSALASPNAPVPPPGAYPLLLSSDGGLLFAGSGAAADFGLSPTASVGHPLPLPRDRAFGTGLAQVEATGRAAILPVRIQGVDRDVFTAPVYGARWVFASPVPISDLEPDISGLTIGVAAGVHRLFPITVLPALLLLLVVAFLVATVLSRRLVRPVRVLTEAAERLATGHTDAPVPPQGRDEVGVLAAALERMRLDINSSRAAILAAAAELEQRVALRTGELRSRNEELLALNELAGSLTRSLDAQLILQDALEAVRAIHPLRAGRGYVLEGEALAAMASWSADARAQTQSEAMLDAIAADVVRTKQPVSRRGRASL